MQVINNNNKFLISWQYDSPVLNHLLGEKNITVEEARKMKRSVLRKVLDVESLPLPNFVTCTISDESGEEKFSHQFELAEGQRYNKEEMRRTSLGIVLQAMYPGKENKEQRKIFYDAYRSRKAPQGLKKFFKLFKKYETLLEENLVKEEAENNVVVSI